MANVTVPTSPPGVWPAETTTVTDLQYAAVEADVLRRKPGVLTEDVNAQDKLDNIEKATHVIPKVTTALIDSAVADGGSVDFVVEFTGDPTPEVRWFRTRSGGIRREIFDGDTDVTIVTTSSDSTLTLANADINVDDLAIIEVEVRNYKATVSSEATLDVQVAPAAASITPNTGGTAGGTATVIAGTNLAAATGVTFDGVAGTAFSIVGSDIHVTSPAHAAGAVDVVIQHPLGNITKTGFFTYA